GNSAVSIDIFSDCLPRLLSPLQCVVGLGEFPNSDNAVVVYNVNRLADKPGFSGYVFFFTVERYNRIFVMRENESCTPFEICAAEIDRIYTHLYTFITHRPYVVGHTWHS